MDRNRDLPKLAFGVARNEQNIETLAQALPPRFKTTGCPRYLARRSSTCPARAPFFCRQDPRLDSMAPASKTLCRACEFPLLGPGQLFSLEGAQKLTELLIVCQQNSRC